MRAVLLLCLLPGFLCACAASEAKPAAPPPIARPEVSIEDQVRQLAIQSHPSPMHDRLTPLIGEWDVTLTSHDPTGKPPTTFRGQATVSPALGGRFVRWEMSVEFGPTPGTSLWFLGYDQNDAAYQLVMMSDLSTSVAVAQGVGDLARDGLSFVWEKFDLKSAKRLQARARLRLHGLDRFTLEQLERQPDGSDRPALVWNYVRRLKR